MINHDDCPFLSSCNRYIGKDHYKYFCKNHFRYCNEYSGPTERLRPSAWDNKEEHR